MVAPILTDYDGNSNDVVMMILMMMLTKITIITTMFLSILIPDAEMEVLPFYANIAQDSSGLSVRKDKNIFR